MNKNIIIAVLAVLLILSAGCSLYLYLQQGNATSEEGKVQTISNENNEKAKADLQKKIDKGLVYAKALDLLLEPARKQSGIPTRQNLSDIEWITELTKATKETADVKLLNGLNGITEGGDSSQMASILFMEYSASSIVDVLK